MAYNTTRRKIAHLRISNMLALYELIAVAICIVALLVYVRATDTVANIATNNQLPKYTQSIYGVQSTELDEKTKTYTNEQSNPQITTSQNNPNTQNPTSSTRQTTAPPIITRPSAPFTISSVTLVDTRIYCTDNRVVAQISSAHVSTPAIAGGTFTWRMEFESDHTIREGLTRTAIFFPNQILYVIVNPDFPGHLYESPSATPGESVRIHVLTPNDISTPWFTVPYNVCPTIPPSPY